MLYTQQLHTIIKIKKTLTAEQAQFVWARKLIIINNPNKETPNIHRTGDHAGEVKRTDCKCYLKKQCLTVLQNQPHLWIKTVCKS